MNKYKGIVMFYINFYPDLGQNIENTVNMIKTMNQPFIDTLEEDGRYLCFIMPTVREGSRVEKIDFDLPHPRCAPQGLYAHKAYTPEIVKKKKNIFNTEEEPEGHQPQNKGFLLFYVNFHPEINLDINNMVELIKKINSEVLLKIEEDKRYKVMILPTVREACRVEKVDYEAPFPRWIAITPTKNSPTRSVIEEDPEEILNEEDEE